MTKDELKAAVLAAIRANGGKAQLIEIAKYIWANHERALRASGDRFYRWQYEMRWLANELRREGKLEPADPANKGIWVLTR